MRLLYPTNKLSNAELLASMTEVTLSKEHVKEMVVIPKGAPQYNAYEKDIAVVNLFFGGSTVLGEL